MRPTAGWGRTGADLAPGKPGRDIGRFDLARPSSRVLRNRPLPVQCRAVFRLPSTDPVGLGSSRASPVQAGHFYGYHLQQATLAVRGSEAGSSTQFQCHSGPRRRDLSPVRFPRTRPSSCPTAHAAQGLRGVEVFSKRWRADKTPRALPSNTPKPRLRDASSCSHRQF